MKSSSGFNKILFGLSTFIIRISSRVCTQVHSLTRQWDLSHQGTLTQIYLALHRLSLQLIRTELRSIFTGTSDRLCFLVMTKLDYSRPRLHMFSVGSKPLTPPIFQMHCIQQSTLEMWRRHKTQMKEFY